MTPGDASNSQNQKTPELEHFSPRQPGTAQPAEWPIARKCRSTNRLSATLLRGQRLLVAGSRWPRTAAS